MTKVKVLQIISGFAIEGQSGGLGRFGFELSRSLDTTRFEPIVCGLWDHGTTTEHQHIETLKSEGVETFTAAVWRESSPYRTFRGAVQAIKKTLNGRSIDIIHSHDQFGDVIALLLKPSLKSRVLIRTVHNEREWSRRFSRRILLTTMIYPVAFNLEVGVSQQVVRNLDARLLARLLNHKSQLIYNSIDFDRFNRSSESRDAIRAELGIPKDVVLIGSVGRLAPQKGYEYLLEAIKYLSEEQPRIKLIIAGDGPLMDSLKSQAKQLKISDHIEFLGVRSDIEKIISAMDIFVSSSLWEGLPTVLLESMAAQVPVIATDVSGSREIVTDDITGFLVPSSNAQALAHKITYVLQNREKADGVARIAKAAVLEKFSVKSASLQYMQAYDHQFYGKSKNNPKAVLPDRSV